MALDATETEFEAQVRAIAEELKPLEGPLLPILHAVQHQFGSVSEPAIRVIAHVLNQTAAEVHGVASFYHDFRTEPAGTLVVKVCRSEACKSMGADALAAAAEERFGVKMGETRPDGAVTLEPIYCLGLCACAPAAMVGDRLVGRATVEKLAGETS